MMKKASQKQRRYFHEARGIPLDMRGWHRIPLATVELRTVGSLKEAVRHHEVLDWLAEHVAGEWHLAMLPGHDGPRFAIWFKRPEDAVQFCLRWG